MAITTKTSRTELKSSFIRMDAEFFRPENVSAYKSLDNIDGRYRLGQLCEKVTQGSNPVFSKSGFPCVNGKNVYFGTMREGEPNYVSEEEFNRLSNFCLRKDDIVITLKHATKIGRAWIVVNENPPMIFARNVGLIRLAKESSIIPSVLLMYLWTKFGQLCLDRCATGGTSGQITLPMSELKRIPIPPFSKKSQTEIDVLYQESKKSTLISEESYLKAQRVLETELGLDKLKLKKSENISRYSTIGLTDTFNAGRIDAQCFAPNAVFYEKWLLKHTECIHLNRLLEAKVKGKQQKELEKGSTDYCSIKHISGHELIGASKCQPASDTLLAAANDLLLAITGATIGKIGIVKRYNKLAFSGDLLCLKTSSGVDPHYLLAVLDHEIGQTQFNRWITGSTNGHLSPRDVGRVLVPRLKQSVESRISDLVEESLQKRIESEKLLEQAKHRVEQLIEQAVEGSGEKS